MTHEIIDGVLNSDKNTTEYTISGIEKITLTKQQHKMLDFISLATSKDENRVFMQGILYEKNHIVGTDGRRLHLYIGDDIALSTIGCAQTILNKTHAVCEFMDVQYPQYSRLIPKEYTMTEDLSYSKNSGIIFFIHKLVGHGIVFADAYIKDLVKYSTRWRAYFTEQNSDKAVLFESMDSDVLKVYAVIMPLSTSKC